MAKNRPARRPVFNNHTAELLQSFSGNTSPAAADAGVPTPEPARTKMTIDLSEELQRELSDIAAQEGVPVSGLAMVFLARGLRDFRSGRLDLEQYRVASKTPRYAFVLRLPKS